MIPSKILAPENVEILHTIDVPENVVNQHIEDGHLDYDSVVLMFPSENAIEIN